jgi:ABC-type glucose/galactose transport system permease subunit
MMAFGAKDIPPTEVSMHREVSHTVVHINVVMHIIVVPPKILTLHNRVNIAIQSSSRELQLKDRVEGYPVL